MWWIRFGSLEKVEDPVEVPGIFTLAAVGRGGHQVFEYRQVRENLTAFRNEAQADFGNLIGGEFTEFLSLETDVPGS